MGKKNQDPDLGSRMNNPDHISKSVETIFWAKILKFFDADPGWKKIRIRETSRIRNTEKKITKLVWITSLRFSKIAKNQNAVRYIILAGPLFGT
jgi:hypothetical protein